MLHNENFLVRTRALAALQELTRTLGPAVMVPFTEAIRRKLSDEAGSTAALTG